MWGRRGSVVKVLVYGSGAVVARMVEAVGCVDGKIERSGGLNPITGT